MPALSSCLSCGGLGESVPSLKRALPVGRGAGSVRAGFSCSRERRGGEETEGLGSVRRVNCPRELEPASSGDSWKALGPHLLATVSTVYYGLFSELRIYSVIQIFN